MAEIFDGLPELESSVTEDTKMVLLYIAGYITRYNSASSETFLNETTFYHQKYGQYLDTMDKGGLNVPPDSTCQCPVFCFILLKAVTEKKYRKTFRDLCIMVR